MKNFGVEGTDVFSGENWANYMSDVAKERDLYKTEFSKAGDDQEYTDYLKGEQATFDKQVKDSEAMKSQYDQAVKSARVNWQQQIDMGLRGQVRGVRRNRGFETPWGTMRNRGSRRRFNRNYAMRISNLNI